VSLFIDISLSAAVVSLAATLVAVSLKQFLQKVNLTKEFVGFVLLSLVMSIPELFVIAYGNAYSLPIEAIISLIASSATLSTTLVLVLVYLLKKGKIKIDASHLNTILKDISFVIFITMLAVSDGVINKIDAFAIFAAYFILIFLPAMRSARGKAIDVKTFLNEIYPIVLGMVIISLVASILLGYISRIVNYYPPTLIGFALALVTTSPQIIPTLISDEITLEESLGSAITVLSLGLSMLPFIYGDVTINSRLVGMLFVAMSVVYINIIYAKIGRIEREEIMMIILMLASFIYYIISL